MTSKLCAAVAVSVPSRQFTVAVDVPGLVLVPTFHVQDTSPDDPATGCGCNPAAVETVPEAYRMLALQVAPGEVIARSVAFTPGLTEAARLVILTESEEGTAGAAALVMGPAVRTELARGDGDGPTVDVPDDNGIP